MLCNITQYVYRNMLRNFFVIVLLLLLSSWDLNVTQHCAMYFVYNMLNFVSNCIVPDDRKRRETVSRTKYVVFFAS